MISLLSKPISYVPRRILAYPSLKYLGTKKILGIGNNEFKITEPNDSRHVLQYLQRHKHHLNEDQLSKHIVVEIKEEDIEEKFARGSGPGNIYD